MAGYMRRRKRTMLVRRKKRPYAAKKTYMIAKKAATVVLNQQLEKHYFDVNPVTFNAGFTGNFQLLTGTTLGDTDLTRTGDKINIKSISIKGSLYSNDPTNVARIIVFQYLGDTGVAGPVIGEILQTTGSNLAPFSPYSKDYAGYKWVPLYDKMFAMSNVNGINIKLFDIKITPRNFRGKAKPFIQYQGGGSNGVGHIYILFISDGGLSPDVSVSYQSRLRFLDN